MRSTDARPMVGTVTTYIVSNSSSPDRAAPCSASRECRDELRHGVAVTDDDRESTAVLAQHAARELGRAALRVHDDGLEIQPLRQVRGRLLRAPRVASRRSASRARMLGVAEHLRQARGAQFALRRQRRIVDGADLLLGMADQHDGRRGGGIPVEDRRRAASAMPPQANNHSGARNVLRRRVSDGDTGVGFEGGVHVRRG